MAIAAIIGAIVGAGIGIGSAFQQRNEQRDQIAYQKEMAWRQYLLGKSNSDAQYGIQKGEAQYQAAKAEYQLGQSVDQSVAGINTNLLAQAYGFQNAQIQTASNTGASLAAEGASGTRGSASGGLMRAYEQQNLSRTKEIQDRQNAHTLGGLTTQAGNALSDILHERDSWDPGGYRYQSKAAQDSYNRGLADLGQSNFDWQTGQVNAALPWNAAFGGLQGASSGWSMGTSLYDLGQTFGAVGGGDK
jgi:hypothetical protein